MATMYDIKIFGERNTGTHALKELIEANSASKCAPSIACEVEPGINRRIGRLQKLRWIGTCQESIQRKKEALLDLSFNGVDALNSWKHCATLFDSLASLEQTSVLFLVRHPGSWLLSLCKNPYHIAPRPGGDLTDFVSCSWKTVERERLGELVLKPLEIYNQKIASYHELREQLEAAGIASRMIKFENNIIDQAGVFEDIRELLADPAPVFKPVEHSTKNSGKSLQDYADYYKREAWRSQLTGIEEEINSQVDWEQLQEFGYQPLK